MNSYEEFALRLEMLLRKKEMTHKQLAEKMYVAPSQISGWKKGNKRISSEQLSQMAEILGVSMDYLWLGNESGNNTADDKTDSVITNEAGGSDHLIDTETAVEVAFNRIAENRKRTIMIQSFSTVVALVLVLYLGLSGAYAKFNETPFWAYSLLSSSVIGTTIGINALTASPFPKFRRLMLILLVVFAIITVALVFGLYVSIL